MFDLKEKTVGEVVAEDYRTAFVFKSHGIDYCCGGKRSIEKACTTKGVDMSELEKELQSVLEQPAGGIRFNDWSAGFLVDYIINNHHRYVEKKLPEILFLADKVARVHGSEHPELIHMLTLVLELNSEMRSHLQKEEMCSFPLIKDMEAGTPRTGLKSLVLDELEEEHEYAGEIMGKLDVLSDNFTPPEGACMSYAIYFRALKEFRDDLHTHVHLENNILFPKVIEMANSAA